MSGCGDWKLRAGHPALSVMLMYLSKQRNPIAA
jgi:hypothetical protein